MKSKAQRALALVLPVQQDIRLPWKRQHHTITEDTAPQKREGHSVTGDLTAEKEDILREWLGYTETCSQRGLDTRYHIFQPLL